MIVHRHLDIAKRYMREGGREGERERDNHNTIIAERLSARQLIQQYGAKSQLEFVCMYVYMYPSRLRMRACHT